MLLFRMMPHKFRDFLALLFFMIYATIQLLAIFNPGTQDDVISARVQDVMMAIIGYYFIASAKENKK
jgi:hypothetical protein